MKWARGFTLVEVLVAAMLVLLAVGSALTLVAQGRRAYRTAEARARLEDTARAALDLLAYEVRLAGFTGSLAPASPVAGAMPAGSPPPSGLEVGGGCLESLALDLPAPIAGADGEYAAAPGLSLGCRAGPDGRTVSGADTLVLRRAALDAAPASEGRLQLETTRRSGRLMTDGLAMLGPHAEVRDVEASVFYVSADATGTSGQPSLRRKRLVGGTTPAFQDEELVAGIADLQVEGEFVIDPITRPVSTGFVSLAEWPAGASVRRLRLWVLVEGDMADGATTLRPILNYANRQWPATPDRHGYLLASRVVEPRNAGARR